MVNFDPDCVICPRLATHLAQVRRDYPSYHAKPVAPFGPSRHRLLIVGLAPGMHGANATGRPFTGDHAGIMLYDTLFRFGFANKAVSKALNDGLVLKNCRITNAVKCLPPENKPNGQEISNCNRFLVTELESLRDGVVVLALGRIAHNSVVKALHLKQKDLPFKHGEHHVIASGKFLVDSYHCSRYNTQTGRLTQEMFDEIFNKVNELLNLTI